MLAIIGGSGLSRLVILDDVERKVVQTSYGEPSGALSFGRIGGRELLFLARHGDDHSIAPHQVNYRANIRALQEAGVKEIVSIATVGGIRREFGPGVLVIPDQIIDYTWGRPSTFFEGPGAKVTHWPQLLCVAQQDGICTHVFRSSHQEYPFWQTQSPVWQL